LGDHFRLSANVTYLDSHYVDYKNATLTTLGTFCASASHVGNIYCEAAFGGNGNPGIAQDLSGRPTSFAPAWSGGLTATYSTQVVGDYELSVSISPYFTSSYFLAGSNTDDPFLKQSAYLRVDARLTLESPDGNWSFDLIGKNLTDRTILTFGIGQPASPGSFIYGKQMPSNIAGQIRYRW